MGPGSDGAELPWIRMAAEAKQAAGFRVLRITRCSQDPAAENTGCKQGRAAFAAGLCIAGGKEEEKLALARAGHTSDRQAGMS